MVQLAKISPGSPQPSAGNIFCFFKQKKISFKPVLPGPRFNQNSFFEDAEARIFPYQLFCFFNILIFFYEDAEARRTKDAIELFTHLGNRFNLSHVAQVRKVLNLFSFPNIIHTSIKLIKFFTLD